VKELQKKYVVAALGEHCLENQCGTCEMYVICTSQPGIDPWQEALQEYVYLILLDIEEVT